MVVLESMKSMLLKLLAGSTPFAIIALCLVPFTGDGNLCILAALWCVAAAWSASAVERNP